MKRILLITLAAFAAACGTPIQQTPTTANGNIEALGPDNDGRFFVIGLQNAAPAGSELTVSGTQTQEVVAAADGSFAVMVRGNVTGAFEVTGGGLSTTVHAAMAQKLNVNTASQLGLEVLPGIAGVKARALIGERAQGGLFKDVNDLVRVSGIGQATVDALRAYIEVDINLNAATKTELMALPTIGDIRSDRIIEYRTVYGPFKAVEDLFYVYSIGFNEVEAVRDYVSIGETISKVPGATLVDINTFGVDALQELPGIGPARAHAIVSYRALHGNFCAKEDLVHVPGIGAGIVSKIRDLITIGILDVNLGTFTGDAAWSYGWNGQTLSTGLAQDLLVTTHYGANNSELVVTIVGGGACVNSTDCAPVAVKALLDTENAGNFRVLGFLPSGDGYGEFSVAYDPINKGHLDDETLAVEMTAKRGNEIYTLDFSLDRVLQ